MFKLAKLKRGDQVAILSPSLGAPAIWPHVYELGLKRLREVFELIPVEYPSTKQLNATPAEKIRDLSTAFADPNIKAVITTIGGYHQAEYIQSLPVEPFKNNPKPFFGYSDNTHLANFLWLADIPSYYGGSIFTQYAVESQMSAMTIKYLKLALFESGSIEIESSPVFNDLGLNWNNPKNLLGQRQYEANDGWYWDGNQNATGTSWGGCLEIVDDMLRCNLPMPSLEQFKNIVLIAETSEEMPAAYTVERVLMGLGKRGILKHIRGILIGRPQGCTVLEARTEDQKQLFRAQQRASVIKIVRQYNSHIPIVQNLDFGHTEPQIPFPYGRQVQIDAIKQKIIVDF